MHDTALEIGRRFFETYGLTTSTIVDLGACNVNGTLRDVSPNGACYIGLDVAPGPGVDVVVKPNTALPLASESVDLVVSSSTLEHDAFFWQTFVEMARITKPGGIIYINAPSNGRYHRYPADNWRFYPDCGKALTSWGACHGQDVALIESFVAERMGDEWNDFVAIFRKNGPLVEASAVSFLSDSVCSTNVWHLGEPKIRVEREVSEDMLLIQKLQGEVKQLQEELLAASLANERLQPKAAVELRERAWRKHFRSVLECLTRTVPWRS
jgi:SAM-dependent methyltransferase